MITWAITTVHSGVSITLMSVGTLAAVRGGESELEATAHGVHVAFLVGFGIALVALALSFVVLQQRRAVRVERLRQASQRRGHQRRDQQGQAAGDGLVMLPGGLIMGLLSPFVGRLYDRHGARVLVIPGTILLSLGMFTLSPTAGRWAGG
jgi:MFS family permease